MTTPPHGAGEMREPAVPPPGFSVTPPPAELPGFDPSLSPLAPGGRADSPEPVFHGERLAGLLRPHMAEKLRVIYRVRREGWVSRRQQARSRFGTITRQTGTSRSRIMKELDHRQGFGIVQRTRRSAIRPRFNLRGLL